jgi:hypothetical protein
VLSDHHGELFQRQVLRHDLGVVSIRKDAIKVDSFVPRHPLAPGHIILKKQKLPERIKQQILKWLKHFNFCFGIQLFHQVDSFLRRVFF